MGGVFVLFYFRRACVPHKTEQITHLRHARGRHEELSCCLLTWKLLPSMVDKLF